MMGPGEGMERESSTIFGVMKINGFQFIKSKVENVGGKSYAERAVMYLGKEIKCMYVD